MSVVVHEVRVTYDAGPLRMETKVTLRTPAARDSVIAWAREQGHEVHWSERLQEETLAADEAIDALREEIRETKSQIGG